MKQELALLFMGTPLWGDPILRESLRRQVRERGWCLVAEELLCPLCPETPQKLTHKLREGLNTLIITEEESLTLVGRILSTFSTRPLTLLEGSLPAPAGAVATRGGYLLHSDRMIVGVLRHDPGAPYPQSLPLGSEFSRRVWQLFLPREEEEALLKHLNLSEEKGIESLRLLPGWLQLSACGQKSIARAEEALAPFRSRTLPASSLPQALIRYLSHEGKTLTFAESCTGGRLAAAVTSESGSSAILEGSYVSYANRIKEEWLGVRPETLERHGAVSEECVREMAAGAQSNLGADIAVAVSGIAGPTGAVPGKPVGTVWFCLRNGTKERTLLRRFSGDRNAVQEQAVLQGLKMILESEEKIFEFFAKSS